MSVEATKRFRDRLRENMRQVSMPDIQRIAAQTLAEGGFQEPPLLPGTKQWDGSIYIGTSPDTGKALYIAAEDAPEGCMYGDAKKYAQKLAAHGHDDWRLPSREELRMIFNEKSAIGTFNTAPKSTSESWYRTAEIFDSKRAWALCFDSGVGDIVPRSIHASVRAVRSPS